MDEERCERCGWTIAKNKREGCVPGDCSYRCDCSRRLSKGQHSTFCPLWRRSPEQAHAMLQVEAAVFEAAAVAIAREFGEDRTENIATVAGFLVVCAIKRRRGENV